MIDETFDIGADTGTPVDDDDYQVPFKFTGKIEKLTIAVEPPRLTAEDVRKLSEAARQAADLPAQSGTSGAPQQKP